MWVDARRALTVTQERHTEPQDKTLAGIPGGAPPCSMIDRSQEESDEHTLPPTNEPPSQPLPSSREHPQSRQSFTAASVNRPPGLLPDLLRARHPPEVLRARVTGAGGEFAPPSPLRAAELRVSRLTTQLMHVHMRPLPQTSCGACVYHAEGATVDALLLTEKENVTVQFLCKYVTVAAA